MDNFLTHFPPQERGGTLVLAMALPADKPQAMVSAEDIGRAAAGKPAAAVSLPLADLNEHWPQGVGLYRWLSERDDAADDVEALPRLIGTPIGFREWVERNLAPVLR
jgi:hypothetical protein